MKFPAKYTQLPNYDYEYIAIIYKAWSGISKIDFEDMVSEVKKSSFKNKYKHRTHLENLGLIFTKDNRVYLTEVGEKIKSNKVSLADGLRTLVVKNDELSRIFKEIQLTGYFNKKIEKRELCILLHNQIYNETPVATLSRYLVPLTSLFNIAKMNYNNIYELSNGEEKTKRENKKEFSNEKILKDIEKVYIEETGAYGEVIAIEKIENLLKLRYSYTKKRIQEVWKHIYENINLRYKYNLIILPIWGTKYKRITINGQSFTHIIINGEESNK